MINKASLFYGAIRYLLSALLLLSLAIGLAFAQDEAAPIKIVSFMPDFYAFWEEAKDKPLEEKIALWDSLFEQKYADFYQQLLYRGQTGEALNRIKTPMVKGFLSSLDDSAVETMKAREEVLRELIPYALADLWELLPEEKSATTHYFVPSLNTTSGAVRPYKGDAVIYYGLEIIADWKNFDLDFLKANIVHETVHVIHFRKLIPHLMQKYQGRMNMMALVQGESACFMAFAEGMAVYTQEQVYPNVSRVGVIEKNVPLYEENFKEYSDQFLKDMERFDYQKYRKYFLDPSGDESIPEKFGYWLGYKVVKSLAEDHSIQEMMNWKPEVAGELMLKVLERKEE